MWTAATAMAANRSAHRSCVSTSHACEKPSASARRTVRQASTPEVRPMPKSIRHSRTAERRRDGAGQVAGGGKAGQRRRGAHAPRDGRATASPATRPRRVRSTGTSPTESANRVSPSKAVWGGDRARAKPRRASAAIFAASGLLRRALVATTPIVVCSGAPKRESGAVERRSAAESLRRSPSGVSRVPAISEPVWGSRTSPTAFTATRAPTTAPPTSALAEPRPPRMARPMPCSLPTLAPVPAPTLPSATGPAAAAAAAA